MQMSPLDIHLDQIMPCMIFDQNVLPKILPLKHDDSLFLLDYQHWCLHELNSDCIPSEKVFNSILNYFNALNDNKKKGVVAKITK